MSIIASALPCHILILLPFRRSEQLDIRAYFQPRKSTVCERIFQAEGIAANVSSGDFPLDFIPFDNDLLSLELQDAVKVILSTALNSFFWKRNIQTWFHKCRLQCPIREADVAKCNDLSVDARPKPFLKHHLLFSTAIGRSDHFLIILRHTAMWHYNWQKMSGWLHQLYLAE